MFHRAAGGGRRGRDYTDVPGGRSGHDRLRARALRAPGGDAARAHRRCVGDLVDAEPARPPHPTLLAGEGDAAVSVAPLPIPGQEPPRADGSSPWMATYSIPKRLFDDGR